MSGSGANGGCGGVPRRHFLKTTGCAAAGLFAGSLVRPGRLFGADSSGKPNILVFFTDEERPESLHLPALLRPNLQRLRTNGVQFDNAYCSYPLCSPSRATIMTGLYPRQCGLYDNVMIGSPTYDSHFGSTIDPALPTDIPNLATVFSAAGYDVGYFGKWHLSMSEGAMADTSAIDLTPYGFEPGNFRVAVDAQDNGKTQDPITTEHAVQWIHGRKNSPRPWLCIVSIINPHDIMSHVDSYNLDDIPERSITLPPNFEDDIAKLSRQDIPEEVRRTAVMFNAMGAPGSEREWRDRLRLYCHLIERTDGYLGSVLDAVEDTGASHKTITVYMADHGEQLASHQAHLKPYMYEEASRIALYDIDPLNTRELIATTGYFSIDEAARAGYPDTLGLRDSAGTFSTEVFLEWE